MDANGYEKVKQALAESNVLAEVSPVPEEGQDFRFVTIYTERTVSSAHLYLMRLIKLSWAKIVAS